MARPIAETPTLRGEDAKRFKEVIRANETKKVSAAKYKKMMNNYNAIKKLVRF